jgi:hypothetical protein
MFEILNEILTTHDELVQENALVRLDNMKKSFIPFRPGEDSSLIIFSIQRQLAWENKIRQAMESCTILPNLGARVYNLYNRYPYSPIVQEIKRAYDFNIHNNYSLLETIEEEDVKCCKCSIM